LGGNCDGTEFVKFALFDVLDIIREGIGGVWIVGVQELGVPFSITSFRI